jgi:glycosyltransferase involved in cell wall biosynthesis
VCTNGSSLPELVVNGHGGFLCASGDVEEFAERIVRLGADAALRERMGEFNRARILEKFTAGRMADDYCRLYEDCAALTS